LGKERTAIVEIINFQNEAAATGSEGICCGRLNVEETVLEGSQISSEATTENFEIHKAVLVLRNTSYIHGLSGPSSYVSQVRDDFENALIIRTVLVRLNVEIESLDHKHNGLV
jgi:hypothetical protein